MDWMAIGKGIANGGRNGMGKVKKKKRIVANRNDQSREREYVCGVVCGVRVDKNLDKNCHRLYRLLYRAYSFRLGRCSLRIGLLPITIIPWNRNSEPSPK